MHPGDRRLRAGAVAVLLAAAAAAYAPSLPGPFTFDDASAVEGRRDLRDPAGLLAAVPRSLAGGGRAVTDLTFAAGYALHGSSAPWYRAVNVVVHLLVTLVLLALAREVLRRAGIERPGLALAAAGLWALHPLGSEAVAYLAQRAESLSAGLAAAAVLVTLRAERSSRPAAGLAGGVALLVLSLGAKGIGVVAFAAVALVLLAFPADGILRWPRVVRATAPLLVAALPFGAGVLLNVRGQDDVGFSMPEVTPAEAWWSQGRVLSTYLRLAVWPAGQSPDHGLPPSVALDAAAVAGWVMVIAFAALCAAGLRRRRDPALRVAALGGLWFLVWLAPTSVLPLIDLVAEHRAYLSLFGLALAAVALGELAVRRAVREPRRASAVALAVALVACGTLGGLLARRAALWGDPVELWSDATRVNPAFFRPYGNLALALNGKGRREEQVEAWRRAVERWPENRLRDALARLDELAALAAAGDRAEAARGLEELLAWAMPASEVHLRAARVWVALGDLSAAELLLSNTAVVSEFDPDVLAALGGVYTAQGRFDDAFEVIAEAVERSGAARHVVQLAELYRSRGYPADACALLAERGGPETDAATRSFGCR